MRGWVLLPFIVLATACGSLPPPSVVAPETIAQRPERSSEKANNVVLYALALLDTGYRFGGKHPAAGLDCSGMVSYIFDQAAGIRVSGSAADIARQGRAVDRGDLRPGDLVFFNTLGQPFSHVGIYIGDEKFVHAPKTNSKVRVDRLGDRYYAQRFEAARSYFD